MQLSQVLIKHILGRICKTNTLQVLNVNILLHVLHNLCTCICMYIVKNTLQSQ